MPPPISETRERLLGVSNELSLMKAHVEKCNHIGRTDQKFFFTHKDVRLCTIAYYAVLEWSDHLDEQYRKEIGESEQVEA